MKQNGLAIQYVHNQTVDICFVALNQNIQSIKYVDIKKFPGLWSKYLLMSI